MTSESERRSVFFWYYDGSDQQAQRALDSGASVAWLKAGGDRGIAWIKDEAPEGFENEQWDDKYLAPLLDRGFACGPWFYNWFDEADKEAILVALAARWPDDDAIVLNPETEWRVSSPANPFRTLAEANAAAAGWVENLRARIFARFGRGVRIGFSSVPTWADFPYEGFAVSCDFAMPQDYWPDELFPPTDGETGDEAGEDEVEAHLRRAGDGKPMVAVLTACREYDDDDVVALARDALGDHPGLAGFSAWEAGNRAYQADAMRRAFALLPPGGGAAPPAGPLAAYRDTDLYRLFATLKEA